MKKLLIILLIGFCFQASAQQKVKSYYIYDRGGYDSLLRIPKDTVALTAAEKTNEHIAIKSNVLYYWNISQVKWMPVSGSGGGISFSAYVQELQGNSSAQFTLSKSPMSGTIEISVNGIEIPPSCYSITVNTILINTSCIGYGLASTDGLIIKYLSTQ